MANYGGQNFTSFSGVNVKGTVALRVGGGASGSESTLSAASDDEGGRSWRFPAKSGAFGITGTFAVNLPAVTSWGETAVTVSGIRREDALLVQIQNMGTTVTTGRTFPIIAGARAEDGYVYLTFYNPTGTATIYADLVCAYTAMR